MVFLKDNAKGLTLLKGVNMKGIEATHDSDCDRVRKLKLISDQLPAT